jgi:mannose-6-phosphate isomerase-like protein (cupin superfamily)
MGVRARFSPLALGMLAAACGGGAPAPADTVSARADRSEASVEAESMDAAGAMPSAAEPGLRGPGLGSVRTGGRPLEPTVTPEPDEVRVRFRQLALGAGEEYVPPVSACQDVLVYVREGTLTAVGAGIATPEAPATLYPGDAVRFGPERGGKITNTGGAPARTIVAYARAAGSGSARPDGSEVGARMTGALRTECRAPSPPADPRVQASRMASERTIEPLVVAGGKLRVRILLDADGAGARHGGLAVLEGDPDATVPEHRHPESAEVLFIEDGAGEMRLGERRVTIRPGSVVYVPPNALHDFRGDGTRPLRAIQVYAPSGPEQRFRTM